MIDERALLVNDGRAARIGVYDADTQSKLLDNLCLLSAEIAL
jgi:hypothetical protein